MPTLTPSGLYEPRAEAVAEAMDVVAVPSVRDDSGKLIEPSLKTEFTDKGDYVLDNQNEDILLWSETGYRFVKRQSQSNPNLWVSLDDLRPAIATATSR